jgi:serine/threonine protein kinase
MTGRQLAHYLVGEKLGEGGMGVVYMGTDTRLKRPVALKFLTRALPLEAKERKRFLREARAASSVNHPNVCVIHAIEEVEGEEFIVMEFVEGATLRKWAHQKRDDQRSKLLPLKDALAIVNQVAEGLDAAHRRGIVHRDVKPENVMITADGRAKIMDFGLAKLAGESKLTRTGATVGTVAYMSPEQVQGGEIDAQSDIFSLGVLFYELLADRTPFIADHVMGMMYAIVNTDPEPIQKVRPGLDPGIAAVVMKCLAKVKKERYATMSEVIWDISRYEKMQRTAVAGRVKLEAWHGRVWGRSPLPRFVRKNIAWIGSLAVVVAATVVYFLAANRPDNTVDTSQGEKSTITSTEQKKAQGEKQNLSSTSADQKATQGEEPNLSSTSPGRKATLKDTLLQLASPGDINTVPKVGKRNAEREPATIAFALELVTNRGSDRPEFREGDTMRTYIRVNKPCTVRIFYHTADGTHYVLTGPRDMTVRSAQVNTLVPIDSSTCSAPFGKERLQAFATTGRFEKIATKLAEPGYYTITGDLTAALAASRGTRAGSGIGAFAEKEVLITTSAR